MGEGLFQPTHLLLILGIALVIFGPAKLGDVGKTLGTAVRDFRQAMQRETPPPGPGPGDRLPPG